MGSLFSWLSGWMSNPLMLGVGALAILSPIIIHLLNKRRFKIVDWAAMSFLFDADKKNRRRVKLENFILLLLRCLAMLLLGLLLAKPFLPSSLAGALGQSQQFQRIILLDDSLSQRTMIGNQTAFDSAKDKVKQLLQMLSTDGNSDYLTLYLTSQPKQPVVANEPVTIESLDTVITRVDELKCSDKVADYTEALAEITNFVESDRTDHNQVVTVLTDMRRRDWQNPESENSDNAPNKLVKTLSDLVPTFLVDVGSTQENNLAITDIKSEDLLVSGTIIRFSVSVSNFGDKTAEDVALRFRVDDFQPLNEVLPSIAPGTTETITFPYMFQYDRDEFSELELEDRLEDNLLNRRIKAEILQAGGARDALAEDSEAFFAARALKGIPVLVVDGDPSSVPERSEAYYLERVEVLGTGLLIDTVTAGEFETISLTKYKVIFICNIDEASPNRVESLRRWVEDGGGVVFMPGDRVRASTFNKTFYDDGNGVSPMKLEVMEGDISRSSWANMEVSDANHPALRIAQDKEVSFEDVEVFSWWRGSVQADQQGVTVSTPILMSNEDRTPAMADKVIGGGRAITWAFSADGDWTMWPSHPTYPCVMWDLINDIVGNGTLSSDIRVGGKIKELVDLTRFSTTVAKTDPDDEKIEVNARPIGESEGEGEDNVLYEVEFDNLDSRGFHELEFRRDGQEDVNRLFAVNIDPAEADLRRIDVPSLPDNYFGENTKFLAASEITSINTDQSKNEIWTYVLMFLAVALMLEQFLGWYFGRKR